MGKLKKLFRLLGQLLCLAGCVWFILPVLHGGFELGAVFGLCVCALGFAILRWYPRLAGQGGWKKASMRLVSVLYVLGLLWAGFLTVRMVSAQAETPPSNTNVIVLGSQVYSAERMGVALTGRVNAAAAYLLENPDAKCIVTGGQGGDEPCPEALAEKNALMRMGIAEDRIFLEDKSRNTRENMKFSKAIAEENGLGCEFLIVTQGFHMFRAMELAKNAGLTPHSLTARTDPILFPEYYGRELLSLTKFHLELLLY